MESEKVSDDWLRRNTTDRNSACVDADDMAPKSEGPGALGLLDRFVISSPLVLPGGCLW